MKFVIETCQEGKPLYLDTQVAIKDNKVTTSIYRKPTSTGVLMIFKSCVPQSWKRNLVKNLYYRKKISSLNICNITSGKKFKNF